MQRMLKQIKPTSSGWRFCWLQTEEEKFWEEHQLESVELPAPEFNRAFENMAEAVIDAAIMPFNPADTSILAGTVYVEAVNVSTREDGARVLTINATIQKLPEIINWKIKTPPVTDCGENRTMSQRTLMHLDKLTEECWKYIDGYRAQTHLEFEKASEMAEAAKEDV